MSRHKVTRFFLVFLSFFLVIASIHVFLIVNSGNYVSLSGNAILSSSLMRDSYGFFIVVILVIGLLTFLHGARRKKVHSGIRRIPLRNLHYKPVRIEQS